MSEIIFKENFIERYSKLTNFKEFKNSCLTPLRRSIRVNTLKISVNDLKQKLESNFILQKIPWCNEGFFIEHKTGRRDIGNTLEHSLGYYYVQEAASMIPPLLLNSQKEDLILDMCASPGSKTTQIASLMENQGLIIANDYKGIRLRPLGINLQKSGITNTIITLMRGQWFKNFQFDKILLDAPCSGTGAIRKSLKTLLIYNTKMITKLAKEQKQLILTAFPALKPKGTLIYSTCSLEPEENEEVIDFLLKKYDNVSIEKINLNIKRSEPILNFNNKNYSEEIKNTLRLWPQDNDTEGFFVAKIKKL